MIAPSRPGYLRTPIDVGRTPQEQAVAYAALLDALAVDEKVFVMGASGGGPSAYAFAALYPERTMGLIAIEALSHPEPFEEEMPGFMTNDFTSWLAFELALMQDDANLVAMMVPDPANQQRILTSAEKLNMMKGIMWSMWPPSQRWAGFENDDAQFLTMALPLERISVPVLAVHGTADTNVTFAQSEYARDRIEDFTLHAIEGADHMMPVTHAEEMGEAIQHFVIRIAGQ